MMDIPPLTIGLLLILAGGLAVIALVLDKGRKKQ